MQSSRSVASSLAALMLTSVRLVAAVRLVLQLSTAAHLLLRSHASMGITAHTCFL